MRPGGPNRNPVGLTLVPKGRDEAPRAEKETHRGDLSPEGAGAAAQRLVISRTVSKLVFWLELPKNSLFVLNN